MDETPTVHRYCPADRAEVFDLFRESFQPEFAALRISQFQWKYEISPFTPPEGPNINILRLGPKLVGLSLGFHLQMWMAGIQCPGEGRKHRGSEASTPQAAATPKPSPLLTFSMLGGGTSTLGPVSPATAQTVVAAV
jgi:hypothetical protein